MNKNCYICIKHKCTMKKNNETCYNIVDNEIIKQFKEYILENNKINKFKVTKSKKLFKGIFDSFSCNWKEDLYMLVYDIKEIPTCNNPECDNKVKLKSFTEGFRKCCCNSCIGRMQSYDNEFKKKSSGPRKNYANDFDYHKGTIYRTSDNFYIFENYCKHGNLKIKVTKKLKDFYKENKIILCEECRNEYINSYKPTYEEMIKHSFEFNKCYDEIKLSLSEDILKKYYIYSYVNINNWSKNILNISLSERIYLYKNQLHEIPICKHENCLNKTRWNDSTNAYTHFCEIHSLLNGTSAAELEVFDFIKSYNYNTKQKYFINKKEYDIIVNDNLLIEYNGLYWHSDISLTKFSHKDKLDLAIKDGKKLFVIWEDDWNNELKKDIIKSMLLYKLNKTPNKIYARKCVLKNVNKHITEKFLNENHIQGYCLSSINYGLYLNDELVSIMTFGKTRMILNSSSDNKYELLRFCNKKYTHVVGGASKLFKHFINNNIFDEVISFSNSDFSDGNIYEKLNFEYVHDTDLNYWWCDKKRHHRSKFMKHKLVKEGYDKNKTENQIMKERGFNKIWGYGNKKYTFKNKKGEH